MMFKADLIHDLVERRKKKQNTLLAKIARLEKQAEEAAKRFRYKNNYKPILSRMLSATDDFLFSITTNYQK